MKTRQLIQFWEQKKQENVPKDWEVDKAPSNQGQVEDNLQDIGPEDLEDTPTLDELVTLYHVTNAPWWATEIQKAKEKGTGFDDLDHPIDPALSLNKRNKAHARASLVSMAEEPVTVDSKDGSARLKTSQLMVVCDIERWKASHMELKMT